MNKLFEFSLSFGLLLPVNTAMIECYHERKDFPNCFCSSVIGDFDGINSAKKFNDRLIRNHILNDKNRNETAINMNQGVQRIIPQGGLERVVNFKLKIINSNTSIIGQISLRNNLKCLLSSTFVFHDKRKKCYIDILSTFGCESKIDLTQNPLSRFVKITLRILIHLPK